MNIVHIGPDSQFVNFLSKKFNELAPNSNIYLMTGKNSGKSLKYLNKENGEVVSIQGMSILSVMPTYIRSADMIIAHGMGPHAALAFAISPRKTVCVWSGWGYDYYGDKNNENAGLLKPETLEAILKKVKAGKKTLKEKLKKRIVGLSVELASRRTNYFSAPIPSDFEVFKHRFVNFKGEYTQLNYGGVIDTFAKGLIKGQANNILLGNSATPTNNHIEAINILAKHDLGKRKVYVPLSYGDSAYRDEIVRYGKEMLGDTFVPLIKFIPLDEYSSIVASCNVVVMNHIRQQALGNIGAALFHGANLYLDTNNPVYKFFNERGAIVHSIQSLTSGSFPDKFLSDDEISKNRSVLNGFWGEQQISQNVVSLLDKVREK